MKAETVSARRPTGRDRSGSLARSAAIVGGVAGACLCAGAVSAAVPVIPGASGYGITTPAGRGGTVYRVTNLNASGAGSLEACVHASGPRVCIFEVSGTIQLTDDLQVWNPNLTIAGQTAPSPGIMVRGGAIAFHASDILMQHIRVRAGDDPIGPDPTNRDSLKIESDRGTISNIVIDHCSFSWATDEVGSAWSGWNNITLSNNIFSEALYDTTINTMGVGGYGFIIGPNDGYISMTNNLLAHNAERNALSRATHFVFVNNVVYDIRNYWTDLQGAGVPTYNSVVGNVYIRGLSQATSIRPIYVRGTESGGIAVVSGSKLYVADNKAAETTTDPWSVVSLGSGQTRSALEAASPPAWPDGLVAASTANNGVLNSVLTYAGARPADRDTTDKRIIADVKNGTGSYINCVSPSSTNTKCNRNAGGWPTLAVNTRPLTLPANPNVLQSSGYTNLEIWLQQMAAEVEGRSTAQPEPPSNVIVK